VRLYPAVDILGGKAVRLVRGDFQAKTVYEEDPLAAARRWTEEGADYLHVVDLDGAKTGEPVNLEQLERIAAGLGVAVQYGGGLRSLESIEAALSAGAARVILGTAAFTVPGLLEEALRRHDSERVLVSVDVRAGAVVIKGWTEAAGVGTREVFGRLIERGVRTLAYTNVDRDGMLDGPNLDELTRVARAAERGRLIYSGGIATLADLEQLAKLQSERQLKSLEGVIVGKALYEGRFSVADARASLAGC
jgi:phosphoribosylformimino-5-aminoimidazole carboxamide ribotide isomerase